ncbi:MAG: YfhO family protein, partial [Armatimonadetes bacterium]|nr:YfhO family protein [Armatimonadota bacterium]
AVEGYRYALLPRRQYEVFEKYIPDGLAGKPSGAARPLQLLRMLSVEYVIGLPDRAQPPKGKVADVPVAEVVPLYSHHRFTLWQVTHPMPFAWLANSSDISYCWAPEAARDVILSSRFRPEGVTAVEDTSRQFGSFRLVEVQIEATVQEQGMSVETNIRNIYGPATADGHKPEALLVLSMAYNPNLVARVDGELAPIYRTNYVLCGVPVPQGKHTVTVRYESQPLRWGLVISLVSVIVVLVLLVTVGRYRRKQDEISDA